MGNATDNEDHDHEDHDHEGDDHGGSGAIQIGATLASAVAFFAVLFIWRFSYDASLKETTSMILDKVCMWKDKSITG